MGELARRRSARDLWISRSHLWALGVGLLLVSGAAFFAGMGIGKAEAVPGGAAAEAGYLGAAAEESLVELLARVEASTAHEGGVTELTFPDTLTGAGTPVAVPPEPPPSEARATVRPGLGEVPPPEMDALPTARLTVEVGRFEEVDEALSARELLRQADLPAWAVAEQVDGSLVYRVGVGGQADEEAAEAVLEAVRALPLGVHARVAPVRGSR